MSDSGVVRDQAEAFRLIQELNPAAFLSKIDYYTRGGLPGTSMSDGRGGGDAIPGFDKADKMLRGKRKEYVKLMLSVTRDLRHLVILESSVLKVAEPIDDKIVLCEVAGCYNELELGRTKGECSTHRSQRSRARSTAHPVDA